MATYDGGRTRRLRTAALPPNTSSASTSVRRADSTRRGAGHEVLEDDAVGHPQLRVALRRDPALHHPDAAVIRLG